MVIEKYSYLYYPEREREKYINKVILELYI